MRFCLSAVLFLGLFLAQILLNFEVLSGQISFPVLSGSLPTLVR